MLISFAGIPLTFATSTGRPFGIRVNGQQLVQVVQLPRALQVMCLDRGNAATTFEFSVKRLFSTRAAAEFFALTHKAVSPTSGLLYVQAGEGTGAGAAAMSGAVLVGVTCGDEGLTVPVTYQFQGGRFAATALIPDVTDTTTSYYAELSSFVKNAFIDLTAGDVGKTVVFASPATSNPNVVPQIVPPSGGVAVGVSLDGVPTTTGFTAKFDAPIPAAGYKLAYVAFYT